MSRPHKDEIGLVTLEEMKAYLGIDGKHLDEQIASFIGLAKEIVEKVLRFPLSRFEGVIPFTANETIKFVVASYYANRELINAPQIEKTAAVMLSGIRNNVF